MAAAWAASGWTELEPRRVDGVEERDGVRRRPQPLRDRVRHRRARTSALTPLADGVLQVDETATIPESLPDLPRVGTVLEIVPGLERLAWFGTGPARDVPRPEAGRARRALGRRRLDQLLRRTSGPRRTAATPTCAGSSCATRPGAACASRSTRPRQVSATHFRAADLAAATHHVGARAARRRAIVHLDAAHRGLGTASCGPDTLPAYLVGPGTYRWSWVLEDLG